MFLNTEQVLLYPYTGPLSLSLPSPSPLPPVIVKVKTFTNQNSKQDRPGMTAAFG